MESLSNKILELRKKNHYSQDELAREVGVTRQAISKWERGEGLPDLYNIKSLANVFGVSVDELLQDETNKRETKERYNNNKLSIILMSIPGFIFLIGLPVLAIYTLMTTLAMTRELFSPYTIELSINLQLIFLPLSLLISFVMIMIYKNMYIGYKADKHKVASIVIYGLLIIGYLLLLAFGEIIGFSFIFLYIIGLLVLISGLVGAILFDTKETYNISDTVNKSYRISYQLVKWLVIINLVILPLNGIKNNFLVDTIKYIDEIEVSSRNLNESWLFLDVNEHSDGNGFQAIVNYKFNIDDVEVNNPYVKFYINNTLITEGDCQILNDGDYDYQYYLSEDHVQMNYITDPELEFQFNIEFKVIISYTNQSDTLMEIEEYIDGDSSIGYRDLTVWIWDKKYDTN